MNFDCLPCAGAPHPTIKQPAGRGEISVGFQFQKIQTSSKPATVWANSHRSLFFGWSLDGRI